MEEEYKQYEERLRSHDHLLHEALKLRESLQPPMPDGLEDDIMRRIAPKRRRVFWLYPAAAVAAAVIVGVLMLSNIFDKSESTVNNVASVTTVKTNNVAIHKKKVTAKPTQIELADNQLIRQTPNSQGKSRQYKSMAKVSPRKVMIHNTRQENSKTDTHIPVTAESPHRETFHTTSSPADLETMFIETAPDNNVLAANRDRMTAEMIISTSY